MRMMIDEFDIIFNYRLNFIADNNIASWDENKKKKKKNTHMRKKESQFKYLHTGYKSRVNDFQEISTSLSTSSPNPEPSDKLYLHSCFQLFVRTTFIAQVYT